MTEHRATLADAFADEPLAGAPVWVLPDAGDVSAAARDAIVDEVGRETAFVEPGDDEVALDVRAPDGGQPAPRDRGAVAALATIATDGALDAGEHTVATGDTVLDATVADDGTVRVDCGTPTVDTVDADHDRVAAALGVDDAALRDVGADLPTAVASVGRRLLVVPVNFLERLGAASPDADGLATLADEYDVDGVAAFTFDAVGVDADLHARTFVSRTGGSDTSGPVVDELGPAGRAVGAVAAYVDDAEAYEGDMPDDLRCEQGHYVDRPGVVTARVTPPGEGSTRPQVAVGGGAAVAVDGTVVVPESVGADDEIVEV